MSWSQAFKDAVVGTCNWTKNVVKRFFVSEEEKALKQQLEELKLYSKTALEDSCMQEQTIQCLCAEVKSESDENQQLWDQVDYLTNEKKKDLMLNEDTEELLRS